MSRRDEVLDAAIDVVGTRGMRGLTHRAVDEAAGVPAGTTSNHFRSRAALVHAIVERMVDQDLAFWDAAVPPTGRVDSVVDHLVGYVLHSVGPGRVRGAARLNLFAVAAVEPELRAVLRRGRAAVERAGVAIGARFGLDPGDVNLVMDEVDALVIRQLALGAHDFDPRPALERLVTALSAART